MLAYYNGYVLILSGCGGVSVTYKGSRVPSVNPLSIKGYYYLCRNQFVRRENEFDLPVAKASHRK